MHRNTLLSIVSVVIILTAIGVYTLSSYRTSYVIESFNAQPINGKYPLEAKIIINYGPFGGSEPLNGSIVWILKNGKFYAMNFTDANGVAKFYVPPGNYTVYFVQFKYYVKNVVISNTGVRIILNYAYLYK
ncbi:MAG: hypothetical protein QXV69_04415 [Sulfolobaceae archaeon]